MRKFAELIATNDPGIVRVRNWIREAVNPCELLLPPSEHRAEVLLNTQVNTQSTLGAIIYETGGILIDGGWLRFLGSGHSKLPRNLDGWNQERADGFCLVADDAVGGFFAINGGALGRDINIVFYWPPDSLEWETTSLGFTDFFLWALSASMAQFYKKFRWSSWREDVAGLSGDSCFSFNPFLWKKQGSLATSERTMIPVQEAFDLKVKISRRPKKKTSSK